MRNSLIVFFLFILNFAQAQPMHFQREFNLNYVNPYYRHERFNSGVRTFYNLASCTNAANFYFVGVGTSYNNTALPAPQNTADRLRFTRTDAAGNVVNNWGFEFYGADNRRFNAHGNSISEVKNSTCNGGYFAVGDVVNNSITGALATGGSDVLITRLSSGGIPQNAARIDINGGRDVGWCIRRSNILSPAGLPTWIICGESRSLNNGFTDCFVARVDLNGNIVWCRRYNFDPTAQYTSAHCIAKQLCEDGQGNIYVVGTVQDNPSGATGIDGLAFKLTSVGNIVWANRYHIASDDEFQAVRFTADGQLIVGGFTNYTNVYNMLITKLSSAGGAIIFRSILRANDNGTLLPSRAYDIIEVPTTSTQGPQYYLAGFVLRAGIIYEMMYRTGANGVPIAWNSYQRMLFNVGFGLDFAPGPCPGIAYFSSMRNPANFSDGHIMKTDLTTRTCLFTPKLPNYIVPPMNLFTVPRISPPTGVRTAIRWATYAYSNRFICSTACPSPTATTSTASPNEQFPVTEQAVPSVTEGSLKIAPNPVINTLRVQFRSLPAGEYQILLMDIEGKMVLQNKKVYNNGSSLTDLDMSLFTPGVYLLRVSQGKMVMQHKVVKQ